MFHILLFMTGIPSPCVYYVDAEKNAIYMEYLEKYGTLKDHIDSLIAAKQTSDLLAIAEKIGRMLVLLHSNNIVHGDLTTSNMLIESVTGSDDGDLQLMLIDFGLTTIESSHIAEDKGMI